VADLTSLFSEAHRRAIADAARSAEGTTSGEIVPFVVGVCDDYREVPWKAAVIGALIGGAGGVALHYLGGFWGGSLWQWVIAPMLAAAAAGVLSAQWSAGLRRFLIGDTVLDLRARRRAQAAFLDEEVFATRDRTGILVFVALFERRVVVMGDAGINRAVPDNAWTDVVADLVAGIRAGRPAEALEAAVVECGRLLTEHRLEIRPDDIDELPNELRLRDR